MVLHLKRFSIRRYGVRRVPGTAASKASPNPRLSDQQQLLLTKDRIRRQNTTLKHSPSRPKSIMWIPLSSAVFQLFAQNLPKSKETKALNMVGPSMRAGKTLRYPSRQNRTVAGLLDRRQLESAPLIPCEGACRIPGLPPSRRAAWRAKHGTGPSSGACPPDSMRCRRGRCRPPRSCRRG